MHIPTFLLSPSIIVNAINLIDLPDLNFVPPSPSLTTASRPGPDYSVGIEYVEACLSDVRKKRHHVVQLAEAKRLTLQQCKQLHSCESDARQVS